MTVPDVLDALREQLDELRTMTAGLDEAGYGAPSACQGWSVADVLLHLAQTNEVAIASIHGRERDASPELWAGAGDVATVDDLAGLAVERERGASGAEVFARWDRGAREMQAAFEACDPAARVQWVVGEMAARTLASTRIAETWIHTGDIADGLAAEREPSDRIWHIARLVHRTVPYAFARSGEAPPASWRFELTAPVRGDRWTFGEPEAETVVTGPALDLCRVAGQRADAVTTPLQATGPAAADVLRLMRTFA